jgi:tRNA threonylcarbamoyladenosine biosynthesis protein TsaB
MSYLLGIDTSSTELGVGLAHDSQVIAGVSRYMRNSHAEHISRSVEFLLSSCGVKPSEVDRAAIAVGPGSFTGLRIGISFLKGFCFGRPVKVLPISSLESMAMSWHSRERPIVVAFDARNGEVFWARFAPAAGAGESLRRMSEDALTTLSELENAIAENDIVCIDTLGNAKSPMNGFFAARPNSYSVEHYPVQRGLACARMGLSAVKTPDCWRACSEIAPKYLCITTMEKKVSCLS